MLRTRSRLASAVLVAGLLAATATAQQPACVCRDANDGYPDLFYNYYVGNGCDQVGAQLYVAPQPVPPLVGHTFITYQPLMPHEFLYQHHHTYYRYYDGGRGMTRASVKYYSPPLRTGLKSAAHHFRIPR